LPAAVERNNKLVITNAPAVRKIRVDYFEATGAATLNVLYQLGTTVPKQVIPASAWVPFLDYWNFEVSTKKTTTSCEVSFLLFFFFYKQYFTEASKRTLLISFPFVLL